MPRRTWRDPVADLLHLLAFRRGAVRRRTTFRWAFVLMFAITGAAAAIPSFVPEAGTSDQAIEFALLLPVGFAGFLMLALVSAVASGGGRELVSRDQAVAFPVSPTTDHLGALVMAPLNIAWLIQAWVLVGTTAFSFERHIVPTAQVVVVLWLAAATAIAQVLAWIIEAVRRGRGGLLVVRGLTVAAVGFGAWLQVSGRLTDFLDSVPTVWLVQGAGAGFGWRWAATVAVELALILGAVLLGILPAHLAARRMPRDEQRLESETRPPKPTPRSEFGMLLRIDRASVWRTVPMRRGIFVLAIGPGIVALAGDLDWPTMTILPGLVASGGALLFGVNAWCLDGRGTLWRESLPGDVRTVFVVRTLVLTEFLTVASMITILLASLRAGIPLTHELTAMVFTVVVVTLQVVAASMRWSMQRPFPVDLRSARATPAPPVVMVAYSSRLAVSTTLTGLVFSALARLPVWQVSAMVASIFLLWSGARLYRTYSNWIDPVQRVRVTMAVTA